jgi:hypothetical protein
LPGWFTGKVLGKVDLLRWHRLSLLREVEHDDIPGSVEIAGHEVGVQLSEPNERTSVSSISTYATSVLDSGTDNLRLANDLAFGGEAQALAAATRG